MKTLTTKNVYLDNLLLGILAGIAIGFGGFLNLLMISLGLKFLGGFLFSIGLFTVCFFSLHLYTGRVGYIIDNPKKYAINLIIMYVGNLIGAIGFGYIIYASGLTQDGGLLYETAKLVSSNKMATLDYVVILKLIFYSIFCGIMVFLAVDIFKKSNKWLYKIGGIVVCVALFVITGMEHCIADMFYFATSNAYSVFMPCFISIVIVSCGNSIGAICSRLVVRHIENNKKE